MYQLGSQKAPPVPEASLKPDGHDFLKKCFIPEPNRRWKAIQLLGHNFVKVPIIIRACAIIVFFCELAQKRKKFVLTKFFYNFIELLP